MLPSFTYNWFEPLTPIVMLSKEVESDPLFNTRPLPVKSVNVSLLILTPALSVARPVVDNVPAILVLPKVSAVKFVFSTHDVPFHRSVAFAVVPVPTVAIVTQSVAVPVDVSTCPLLPTSPSLSLSADKSVTSPVNLPVPATSSLYDGALVTPMPMLPLPPKTRLLPPSTTVLLPASVPSAE